MVDLNKAADLLLALGVVVVFAGGGFWLRRFILKERIALSGDNLKRARAEARELGRKLFEAENRNSMLQQMIVNYRPCLGEDVVGNVVGLDVCVRPTT